MTVGKPAKAKRRWGTAVFYLLLPIAVFIFTSLPWIGRATPLVALGLLAALAASKFFPRSVPRGLVVTGWTICVLALVGASGWFFSPFFFALYLMAIALGFIYVPLVAVAFTGDHFLHNNGY